MRGLDPDDQVGVLAHLRGRGGRVHVGDVVFVSRDHAVPDDVDEGKDAGDRAVGDARLEVFEGAPPRAAAVDRGGDAGGELRVVGEDRSRIAVMVGVQVDQAGRDVEVAHVQDAPRFDGRDVGRHARDAAARDGDVHHAVDVAGRVDDMAPLEQEIVTTLREKARRSEERNQENTEKGATTVHGRPCSANCLRASSTLWSLECTTIWP